MSDLLWTDMGRCVQIWILGLYAIIVLAMSQNGGLFELIG